jgi:hypothetical protein
MSLSVSRQEEELLAHVRDCTLCQPWANTGGGYLLCETAMQIGGNIGYAAYRRTVETVRAERVKEG